MDNLTKVHGAHVFKFGFYFQSASNASNSQAHVQSDIDFTTNASIRSLPATPSRTPCWGVQLLRAVEHEGVSELPLP